MVNMTLLRRALARDEFWRPHLQRVARNHAFRVHLAIFREPFLAYVLEGVKTIESRFGSSRAAPFRRVATGDVILLKRSSGPVVGICRVADVWFYELDRDAWEEIDERFSRALCLDEEFLERKRRASFATLIRVDQVRNVEPIAVKKRDRRGWVILRDTKNL